ncbi:MAG TPA: hypothetical protein IGS52_07580 [Oscillatoriaceae cyanobacterium M33_DOE_052]|uniref:DUF5678 domain-containing protein n=1 Tax=Planktothricoides sp. SpSt-374 TaxID=2282167 RepID=A0A7C3VII4_9CYAN|nr:hypothetical protein [Oscillatoriaceae cyanobacterium M33_DOE_052]
MRKISENHQKPRLGGVFPELNYTPEELARLEAERDALFQRCNAIFRAVQPELINDHYDWFMVIEPESGDYFIDKDEDVAKQKADAKYPNCRGVIFCINETGACEKI